jgi:chloramphenicol-sensitive protein RarD
MNQGTLYAVAAYALWGLFPVYFKLLRHVPAPQILCHRILWSFVFLMAVVLVRGEWSSFRAALKPAVMPVYMAAAVVVSANWLTYVWAVNAGFVVQTSLGYFINPLLSVLAAVIILGERLRPWQWVPVGLAALGILYLTYSHGSPPWIALFLALTWAVYGLLKKIAPLGTLHGLTLETGLLTLPALIYLTVAGLGGRGAFLQGNPASDMLLAGTGLVTATPLFLFALAVRRIRLTIVGILQYVSPTLQFLLGVLVFREPFTTAQFIGFSIVWLALIIFGVEGYLTYRAETRAARAG